MTTPFPQLTTNQLPAQGHPYPIGSHTHTITNWPNIPKERRQTPFEKAMNKATGNAETKFSEGGVYYAYVTGGQLIDAFGKLKPVYNGRPQLWLNIFLNSCPSPMRATSKTGKVFLNRGMHAGMFYRLPAIPKRRRARYRITASTVALLDHWAKYNPKFRPFLDAYLTPKARDEISRQCALLAFGICPEELEVEKMKAEEAEKKVRQEQAEAMQLIYQQQQIANQSAQSTSANSGLGLLGALGGFIGGNKK